jgi:hypothetical protein
METFLIEAYSHVGGPSLWCEEWKCPMCNHVHADAEDFGLFAPLHNPFYCRGILSGDPHPEHPCVPQPGTGVYQYDIPGRSRTLVGRIPETRRV